MKLMKASEWAKTRFTPESVPSRRTLSKWCAEGTLPAKKIGGLWFVDPEVELNDSGNELVDLVLNSN